jgi:hypothetical protein
MTTLPSRATGSVPGPIADSQFADLEPLRGEAGLTVDAARPPEEITATVLNALAPDGAGVQVVRRGSR